MWVLNAKSAVNFASHAAASDLMQTIDLRDDDDMSVQFVDPNGDDCTQETHEAVLTEAENPIQATQITDTEVGEDEDDDDATIFEVLIAEDEQPLEEKKGFAKFIHALLQKKNSIVLFK
ncbi:hypothetical protein CVT24_006813 [Panaeolus cyanescens]|uniref:Uncharacterized protein n=1 Tax=Panaeolus cyanescens TaxID=181874 RepID=A0A409V9C9_9AGAR|nr:hypothetical protein CVT24_006813 [Panaeolus cyanescens]